MRPEHGRSLMLAAAFIVVAAGMKAAEAIMVPFLLAAFIATIAATPVFWLKRMRVPVWAAITLVMIVLMGIVFGVGAIVAQSIQALTQKLPFYQERLFDVTRELVQWLQAQGFEVSAAQIRDTFDPSVLLQMAGTTVQRLGGALGTGFLILLTVIFILAEASSFPVKLRAVLKDPERDMPHFVRFAQNMNRYIAIKTTISLLTGLVIGTFLSLMGVDFPVLWGLIAFLLNYVPTIGSFVAAIPAVLLAVIQIGPGSAAFTIAVYAVTNVLFGNAIEPRLMGRGLGLSTMVVFLSLVFWGWMLGPVGALLSVPLTMTVKMALEANPATHWMSFLLGPAIESESELAAARETELANGRILADEAARSAQPPARPGRKPYHEDHESGEPP